MKRHRSGYCFILVGIFFISTAIALQVKLSTKDTLLKPLDSDTIQELYNPQHNQVAGNPNGKITLVEFLDYNCSDCRNAYPKIKALADKNPDLRIVFKELLLFGDSSVPPTSAALAAQKQGKYAELQHAFITATQPLTQKEILDIAQKIGLDPKQLALDMSSQTIQKQALLNTELARTLKIDSVPSFIVAKSEIAKHLEKKELPQYLFKGTHQLEKNLQHLIDHLKKDAT